MSRKIEDDDADIIVDSKTGKFRIEMNIASAYYGYIIGKNGEQKKRLENETRTSIAIPPRHIQRDDAIVNLQSDKKSNIISCKNRILLIVNNARQKQQFNHLITFPLVFESLKERLRIFKDEVIKKCSNDRGVDASVMMQLTYLKIVIKST